MIIKALAENISDIEDLACEHGLSLCIETKNHKILFDTGASNLFAVNAAKMGVDLSKVDLAVISHGHYDHGGGLKTFLSINSKAKVYLHEKAFEKHYSHRTNGEKAYIGLDETLLSNERLIFVQNHFIIDKELELFSDVKGKKFNPSGNKDLFMKEGEVFLQDDFRHEQNLIISEEDKMVLIAGCAHNGIVNIIEHYNKEKGKMPDFIIGGFHLYNRSANQSENPDTVAEIGEYLAGTKSKYYTCHCTGIEAYKLLKNVMGDNIEYLSTGTNVII